jgi:hypothetical protein
MAKSSPALSLLACNQHPSLLTSSSLHLPVTRVIPNQQQHYYRDSDVALNTRVARVSRRLEKSPFCHAQTVGLVRPYNTAHTLSTAAKGLEQHVNTRSTIRAIIG